MQDGDRATAQSVLPAVPNGVAGAFLTVVDAMALWDAKRRCVGTLTFALSTRKTAGPRSSRGRKRQTGGKTIQSCDWRMSWQRYSGSIGEDAATSFQSAV